MRASAPLTTTARRRNKATAIVSTLYLAMCDAMRFIFAVPVHGDLPPHAPSTVTAQMRPREGVAFRFHAFTLSRRVGRRAPGFRLEEVASTFRGYGLKGHELDHVTNAIAADPKRWVDSRMQFELGLDP
jgi:hypothetical protein